MSEKNQLYFGDNPDVLRRYVREGRRTKVEGRKEEGLGTVVYLLYNGVLKDKDPKGGNVLTSATLRMLPPHAGRKVVYGTASLGAGTLKYHGVTFRQIPCEVKAS